MDKHSSNVRKLKHFLLGAGLVLTLAASTTLAQVSPPVSCAALGGQLVAPEDCPDGATTGAVPMSSPFLLQPFNQQFRGKSFIPDPNVAANEKAQLEQSLASGLLQAGQIMSCSSAGAKRMSVEECIKAASDVVASGGSSTSLQSNFPNQQSLFGQQQQTQPQITTPAVKTSNVTLALKGLKLTLKMESTLNSKYKKTKGKTKKLAAVRSIAKKLSTLCRYISSGDDEADLDENAFDCDAFVAELSEPIGDALKAKDHEVAYESTVAALESFEEVFESLQQ